MKTTTLLLTFFSVTCSDSNNGGRPDLCQPQSDGQIGVACSLNRIDGEGTFTPVGSGKEAGNVDAPNTTWGDYDQCGFLDLFVSCPYGPGDGYSGRNSLHVGPSNAVNADLVRIEWPSVAVQELHDVASGQFHTVTEPGGEPQLTSTRVNDQQLLTLTGKQGCHYDIETSTDLTNWISPLNFTVTVTNTDGTLTVSAPGETSDSRRFYRAVPKYASDQRSSLSPSSSRIASEIERADK